MRVALYFFDLVAWIFKDFSKISNPERLLL